MSPHNRKNGGERGECWEITGTGQTRVEKIARLVGCAKTTGGGKCGKVMGGNVEGGTTPREKTKKPEKKKKFSVQATKKKVLTFDKRTLLWGCFKRGGKQPEVQIECREGEVDGSEQGGACVQGSAFNLGTSRQEKRPEPQKKKKKTGKKGNHSIGGGR